MFHAPHADRDADSLLSHFRDRERVRFFAHSKGSPARVEAADRVLVNDFTFNNERHQLADSFDWLSNPSLDVEWLIALHKFYYAKDLAAAYAYSRDERYAVKWMRLVDAWMAQVPLGFIDSQVTGRRLQQWVHAFFCFVPGMCSPSVDGEFVLRFLDSLHRQAHYLTTHLTHEGNHRTIELYGIFLIAVLFPELKGSGALRDFAVRELLQNLRHDLLADGVHRELSTEYHHTVLENFLRVRRLATINDVPLPVEFDERVNGALRFSMHVHKPDGTIPAINDADWKSFLSVLSMGHDCYPDPALRYVISAGKRGSAPASRSAGFPDSGYYIMRSDWTATPFEEAHYLFFDCAEVGSGTHGHYDLLNVELAAYGHSLIVDPGRYTYSETSTDEVNWRAVFRGTAQHNTVLIDGMDQIPYRLENSAIDQPRATLKTFATTRDFDVVQGMAESPRYPVIHERTVFFIHAEYWIIADRLIADDAVHCYDLRFHLHPRTSGHAQLHDSRGTRQCVSPNLVIAHPASQLITTQLENGYVSPRYGVKESAPVLTMSQSARGVAAFDTVIYPFRAKCPNIQVREIPIGKDCDRPREINATALRIEIESEACRFEDVFFLSDGEGEINVEDMRVHAKLLFVRRNAAGRIERLHGVGVRSLSIAGEPAAQCGELPVTLNYCHGDNARTESSMAVVNVAALSRIRQVRSHHA